MMIDTYRIASTCPTTRCPAPNSSVICAFHHPSGPNTPFHPSSSNNSRSCIEYGTSPEVLHGPSFQIQAQSRGRDSNGEVMLRRGKFLFTSVYFLLLKRALTLTLQSLLSGRWHSPLDQS